MRPPDVARRAFANLPPTVRTVLLHARGDYAPWEAGFDFTPPDLGPGEAVGPPDFVGVGVQKAGTSWWYELIVECEPPKADPMEQKLELARLIVARSHGEEAAAAAAEHFSRVVRQKEAPERIEEAALPSGDQFHLPSLLVEFLDLASTSEARRMITQGGVKLNGEVVKDLDLSRDRLDGALVQAGKRRYVRFLAS